MPVNNFRILLDIEFMQNNIKQTQLIIHCKTEYALEASDETLEEKVNEVEMGPVNPNNKHQLWLF